jgi:hypothetical protein
MKNRRQRTLWLQVLICASSCLPVSSLEAQTPLGPAFLVNPPSVGTQDQPDLHLDESGNLWIAWIDFQDVDGQSSGFDRLMARSISPQGELDPALVLADTSDIPFTPITAPRIVPGHDGSLQLFYIRSNADGFDLVYGQKFSTVGYPLTDRTLV